VSGAGLKPNSAYSVTLSSEENDLEGPWVGFVLASFTSASDGKLPSGVKVIIPDVSTEDTTGDTWYIHCSTNDELADLESSGIGPVNIMASLKLTPKTGATNSEVNYEGRGLGYGETYTIRFGFVDVDHTGTGVGSLTSDDYGRASGSFTVPEKPAGTYEIQLKCSDSYDILNVQPVFTITGTGGGAGGPIGTGTLSPSNPQLLSSSGSQVSSVLRNTGFFVQVQVKSNIGSDLSVYVLVQIRDGTGSVVAIGLTAADVNGGATKAVPIAFTGISTPGSYAAGIYIWDSISNPTPLSPTSVLVITVT
jgi:hypothetical protein